MRIRRPINKVPPSLISPLNLWGSGHPPFFYFFYLFLDHLTFGGEEATILSPYYYLQMAKGNKNGNKSPSPLSLLAAAFQQVAAAAAAAAAAS